MPLKAKMKNTLDMEDVGDWKDPYQVSTGLLQTPVGNKRQSELLNMQEDMTPEMESFEFGEEAWRDSPEAAEFMDELRDMVREEGYDSIRYANQVENKYGSQSGLTPSGEKKVKNLQMQIKEINDAAYKRDDAEKPPPPTGSSEKEVEAWLSSKRGPNEQETKKIQELQKKIGAIRETEAYDPNSYILLDSNQLRSINAEFDPEQIESSNILSSILDQRFRNIA